MRCRPGLLWVLAVPPLAVLFVVSAAGVWQTWLGLEVRAYAARQHGRAEHDRRQARYRAADNVVGELFNRRLLPGHPLRKVVGRFPPTVVHTAGRRFATVMFDYGDTWVHLTAVDGRVVRALVFPYPGRQVGGPLAGSADVVFSFDAMPPADQAAFLAAGQAEADARRAAGMAVGGPLGFLALCEHLPTTP